MERNGVVLVLAAALGLGLSSCDDGEHGGKGAKAPPAQQRQERKQATSVGLSVDAALQHFAALPKEGPKKGKPTAEMVALGRQLYFDKRLSKNHDVACATCHDLAGYGVDVREEGGKRIATSIGHKGQKGGRNAPTVYNAVFNLAQFWDGRAADLEAQAKGPVLNPIEMAMPDEASVVTVLESIPGYTEAFAKAFPASPDPVTYDNMATAIGAFERDLLTPAPVDKFLEGELSALNDEQLRGMKLFIDTGCIECHSGMGFGGASYQKLGNVKPWPELLDEGRSVETKNPDDKFKFKVPTLRNIAETGPYLHDGSIDDLGKMVQMMAVHQLGKSEFAPEDLAAVVAFLDGLTGTIDPEYTKEPTLPESGPDTPAPDPA